MDYRTMGHSRLGDQKKKPHGETYPDGYDKGTCLLVEGLSLEIVDDSSWKKPEEIKKEIREKYQKYRTEKGHEPHFLECVIRWNDTLETLETRIALNMDSDTEMDDEIFFYCDTLDSLLSLSDKSGEDFIIAGCFGFGENNLSKKTRNPDRMTGTSLLPFYSADATTKLARALFLLQR